MTMQVFVAVGAALWHFQVCLSPDAEPLHPRPPEMVRVSGGAFVCGGEGYPKSTPKRLRILDAFEMGRFEVSEAEFSQYVEDVKRGNWSTALVPAVVQWQELFFHAVPNNPCEGVTWEMANDYVAWLSDRKGTTYRLPTETEWEFCARGAEGRQYPWGGIYRRDAYNGKGMAGVDTYEGLAPVNAFPDGATSDGILNMSGNVREWTASRALILICSQSELIVQYGHGGNKPWPSQRN